MLSFEPHIINTDNCNCEWAKYRVPYLSFPKSYSFQYVIFQFKHEDSMIRKISILSFNSHVFVTAYLAVLNQADCKYVNRYNRARIAVHRSGFCDPQIFIPTVFCFVCYHDYSKSSAETNSRNFIATIVYTLAPL